MAITLKKISQKSRRRGRGIARGGAKSGRGMKGQKARAGYSSKPGFEGGQTPLYMRLPKGRGTKQKFPSQVIKPLAVQVKWLNSVEEDIVGPGLLRRAGLLEFRAQPVKLIGSGEVTRKMTVRVHAASESAKAAVEKAGGKVEIISR